MDQIPDLEGFHPGLTAALIHISVARAETGESAKVIRETVGRIKVADLEQVFGDMSVEVDELPPPDAGPSSSPNDGSGEASSTTGEQAPVNARVNGSGSPGSDTGATSDPLTSVL